MFVQICFINWMLFIFKITKFLYLVFLICTLRGRILTWCQEIVFVDSCYYSPPLFNLRLKNTLRNILVHGKSLGILLSTVHDLWSVADICPMINVDCYHTLLAIPFEKWYVNDSSHTWRTIYYYHFKKLNCPSLYLAIFLLFI